MKFFEYLKLKSPTIRWIAISTSYPKTIVDRFYSMIFLDVELTKGMILLPSILASIRKFLS
jgi:hypothetical protein